MPELTQKNIDVIVRQLQGANHDLYGMILDLKVWTEHADKTPEELGYSEVAPLDDDLGLAHVMDRIRSMNANLSVVWMLQRKAIEGYKETRLREVRMASDIEATRRVLGVGS